MWSCCCGRVSRRASHLEEVCTLHLDGAADTKEVARRRQKILVVKEDIIFVVSVFSLYSFCFVFEFV